MNAFDELTARNEHAQDIAATRVGYLGGSDAKMVYKVAMNGVGTLSRTDVKRLRVCMGIEQVCNFAGNTYTERGHDFEDYIAGVIGAIDDRVEREHFMEGKKYNHFQAMAHADYYIDGTVYECKCVEGKTTARVANDYAAQLQWYYMLGAEHVYLVHGTDADTIADMVEIPRNDGFVAMLERGCELIDAQCEQLEQSSEESMSVAIEDAPEDMRDMITTCERLQRQIKEYTEQLDAVRERLYAAMVTCGIGDIHGDSVSVRLNNEKVVKTIDKNKLLAAFPSVATADVYSETTRKGSVTITFKP